MKIRIKTERENKKGDVKERQISFILPTAVVFSRLGLRLMKKHGGADFSSAKPSDMRNIRRTVCKMRRLHRGWVFLEAESGGSGVKITF